MEALVERPIKSLSEDTSAKTVVRISTHVIQYTSTRHCYPHLTMVCGEIVTGSRTWGFGGQRKRSRMRMIYG